MSAVCSNKKLTPRFEISHDSSQQVFINQSDYRYAFEPIIHWAVRLSRHRPFDVFESSHFYCKTRGCDPFLSHYIIVSMCFIQLKPVFSEENAFDRNCHFTEFNGNRTNGTVTFDIGEFNDVQRSAYPLLLTWHVLGKKGFSEQCPL